MRQRTVAGRAAVLSRRRPDADLRHHAHRQLRAWLDLHAGRVRRLHRGAHHRQLLGRADRRADRGRPVRHRVRTRHPAPPVPPRRQRLPDGHLRAGADPGRGDPPDLGLRGATGEGTRRILRRRVHPRRAVPALSPVPRRRRHRGGDRDLAVPGTHAPRPADPRHLAERRDGARARHRREPGALRRCSASAAASRHSAA